MGCVLGAVTPAVIVPAVEDMKQRGLVKTDVQKNIVNLIVAASSFDDVLAISLFNLILGILISYNEQQTDLGVLEKIWLFVKGPVFVVVGILVGYILAVLLGTPMDKSRTFTVFVALVLPITLNQSSIVLNISSAGPIACIFFGFIIILNYSRLFHLTAKVLDSLWLVLEPAMFVLIGAELDLTKLDPQKLLSAALLLLACLTLRTTVAFLIARFGGFDAAESTFVSVA